MALHSHIRAHPAGPTASWAVTSGDALGAWFESVAVARAPRARPSQPRYSSLAVGWKRGPRAVGCYSPHSLPPGRKVRRGGCSPQS